MDSVEYQEVVKRNEKGLNVERSLKYILKYMCG